MLQLRYEQSILEVITILLCLFSELQLCMLQNQGSSLFIRVDAHFLLLVYVQSSAPFWPVRGFLQICRYLIGFIANDKFYMNLICIVPSCERCY